MHTSIDAAAEQPSARIVNPGADGINASNVPAAMVAGFENSEKDVNRNRRHISLRLVAALRSERGIQDVISRMYVVPRQAPRGCARARYCSKKAPNWSDGAGGEAERPPLPDHRAQGRVGEELVTVPGVAHPGLQAERCAGRG
jgi:hypothetical protein